MNTTRVAVAVVLLVVGVVWVGQGLGYIGGSFMSSDIRWALVGGACVIAAVVLLWSVRRNFQQ